MDEDIIEYNLQELHKDVLLDHLLVSPDDFIETQKTKIMEKKITYDFEKLKTVRHISGSSTAIYHTVDKGSEDDILNTKVIAWLKDNDLGIDGEMNLCEHSKIQGSTHVTHKEFLNGLKLKLS